MEIVVISDTHGFHSQLKLPAGDMLIHAGDVSTRGLATQIEHFLDWFAIQPYKYKIMIAGNHDFFFEEETLDVIQKLLPPSVIYLQDSFTIIEGIKIWGSPVSTWFYDWAFNKRRGTELEEHWEMIPNDADIVITHGPPYHIMDRTLSGVHVGCASLLKRIKYIKPKLHIFGHIHEGYGIIQHDGTTFINGCVINAKYKVINDPLKIIL